ncbi:hypothetical protein AURDEDRAFT_112220 [Auricularia subglabra TFB-10046 SS5]|nr:hypothetical protein AURDEDRAFT_112220 [Auricularia subglabra TFB-10046 SS5]
MSTTNNDGGMLAVGELCEHPSCMLVDFLPFKCTHCSHKYCLEHFQPNDHNCTQYDPSAGDRIAPNCPFCNVPIAYAKGTDPNVRMERHFDTECAVLVDEEKRKRAQNKMPVCRARGCSKKLVAPIQCQECRQKYCAEHRYASDHACSGPSRNTSSSASTTSKSTLTGGRPGQSAPGAHAALAALKRNIAAAKTAATKATPTSKPPARTATAPAPQPAPKIAKSVTTASSSSGPAPPQPAPKAKVLNPFSKTDRRARAEAESRRKALRDRERRGLLSDADKARLAEMDRQAEEADKETCIIS